MKKLLVLSIAVLAMGAFLIAPAMAGENCGAKGHATAKPTSNKSACTGETAEACAERLGISPDECKELCASGKYTVVNMSIDGMTCGGCESSVTSTLSKIDGVYKVGQVSHKTGSAIVMIEKDKCTSETLVKAISNKGYKVEIVPAAAVTSSVDSKTVSGDSKACAKVCSSKEKAACAGKEKAEAKDETSGTD